MFKMKKLILFTAIVAIAAVAAFNLNLNLGPKNDLSAIALANIEALANNESGSESDKCYQLISSQKEMYWDGSKRKYRAELTYTCEFGNVSEFCKWGLVFMDIDPTSGVVTENDYTRDVSCRP